MFPTVIDLPPFARPRLVVSRCLDLEPCRYNGAVIETPLVRRLEGVMDLVPVCPEVELGLGVPRPPIRLVRRAGGTALLQPATGRDLTREMAAFAGRYLDALPEVDGFLLKARSPSCGVHGVKVFPDVATEAPDGREPGMFARAVLSRFPHLPVEHEGRLSNPRLLDHFLSRLFALADLRRARDEATPEALLTLHQRYELARRTFDAGDAAALDALVERAAAERSARAEDWAEYARRFRAALAPVPRESAHLDVIRRVARPLRLSPAEAGELDRMISSYAEGATARGVLLERLRALGAGGGTRGGAAGWDAYLAPYPAELALSP
jgi:uncharacterized protein YbbK (DUF523 family)/uncharacterized protein YbgA (DUF1722 family)